MAAAESLVYELAHASRLYGTIDWCVGVFRTASGTETIATSNEGLGYIPQGVFVPRSVRMLFSDSGLDAHFRRRWFGWANPARTMLAYAELLADHEPRIELHAIATSTDHGGTAQPARDAAVQLYVECSLASSPIAADADPAPLDAGHVHRLETLERGALARLTGGAESAPDRSEAWTATVTAVRTALDRAACVAELAVPPEIRATFDVLVRGEQVTPDRWEALEFAALSAVLNSASHRPGYQPETETASPFARAHHDLARAAELLLLWRDTTELPFAEIAYIAAQVTFEARLWPVPDR